MVSCRGGPSVPDVCSPDDWIPISIYDEPFGFESVIANGKPIFRLDAFTSADSLDDGLNAAGHVINDALPGIGTIMRTLLDATAGNTLGARVWLNFWNPYAFPLGITRIVLGEISIDDPEGITSHIPGVTVIGNGEDFGFACNVPAPPDGRVVLNQGLPIRATAAGSLHLDVNETSQVTIDVDATPLKGVGGRQDFVCTVLG